MISAKGKVSRNAREPAHDDALVESFHGWLHDE
jgi:hypothetical protein